MNKPLYDKSKRLAEIEQKLHDEDFCYNRGDLLREAVLLQHEKRLEELEEAMKYFEKEIEK